jgi:hypothetical protein
MPPAEPRQQQGISVLAYVLIVCTPAVCLKRRESSPAMENTTPFAEALEATARLTLSEQEELIDILHRRIIERRRAGLLDDSQDAEREFQAGECRLASPSELIKEIL